MLAAGRRQFAWEVVNTQPAQRPVGRAQIVTVHSDEEWGCDPVVPPLIWPLPLDLNCHSLVNPQTHNRRAGKLLARTACVVSRLG